MKQKFSSTMSILNQREYNFKRYHLALYLKSFSLGDVHSLNDNLLISNWRSDLINHFKAHILVLELVT